MTDISFDDFVNQQIAKTEPSIDWPQRRDAWKISTRPPNINTSNLKRSLSLPQYGSCECLARGKSRFLVNIF